MSIKKLAKLSRSALDWFPQTQPVTIRIQCAERSVSVQRTIYPAVAVGLDCYSLFYPTRIALFPCIRLLSTLGGSRVKIVAEDTQ